MKQQIRRLRRMAHEIDPFARTAGRLGACKHRLTI